jgi:hypothetical protein
VPLNILASDAMRAKIASPITISARLSAGSIVLVSQPDPVPGDQPGRWIAPAGLSYAAHTPMLGKQMTIK